MIVFTVHEPPDAPADRIDRAEKLEFIRDGFTPLAAGIPPLWMALNKLWIVLLLYLLVWTGLGLLLSKLGVDKGLIGLISIAANIVIGFEADSLKRWTLGRRGWAEVGTVTGKNRAECERRFFDGWLVEQPLLRRSMVAGGNATPNTSPRAPKLLTPVPAAPVASAGAWQQADHVSVVNTDSPSLGSSGDAGARPLPDSKRALWRRLLRR
jgi:Protein of unknown function (DUF2628)